MAGRPLAGFFLALLTTGVLSADDTKSSNLRAWEWWYSSPVAAVDDPKAPDPNVFDKLVVDTLRDVHNKGADLYNTAKDFAGTFRLYQGALLTVRPLLSHRPAVQKVIDDGLAAADKETSVAQKAFKLHEAIEEVRAQLKAASVPTKKPDEVKKPDVKKPDDKKPDDTKKPMDVKKPDEPKKNPINPDLIAPPPREKKTPVGITDPKPKGTGIGTKLPSGLAGKVTLRGLALPAGDVILVSLDQAKPRVFVAAVQADGSYAFVEPVPPGKYVVIVNAKLVPEKYQTATTSGLTIEVKPGPSLHDFELK